MIFYFIILPYLFTYIYCIIKLDFFKKNSTIYDFENDTIFSNYYSKITVGTPSLEIESFITLESNSLYITQGLIYNSNSSSSYLELKPEQSHFSKENFEKAILSSETFLLFDNNKKTKIENIQFMLATKTSIYQKEYPMSIGLKAKDTIMKDYNLIYQLKKNNYIQSYSFTIIFEDENKGKILIGGIPHEYDDQNYFSGAFRYTNLCVTSHTHYWEFTIEHIYCNNEIIENNKVGHFSMDYGVLIGTNHYKDIIYKQFFNEKIESKICKMNSTKKEHFFYLNCNENLDITKFPSLKFESKILNYTFELNYTDLFKKENDGSYSFLIIFDIYMNTDWVLGIPFFKKYQFIFDQDREIIGFYIYKLNNNNISLSEILSIIFLFIIIILTVLYLRVLLKKKRKIRVNELDENFDYIPFKKKSINDN